MNSSKLEREGIWVNSSEVDLNTRGWTEGVWVNSNEVDLGTCGWTEGIWLNSSEVDLRIGPGYMWLERRNIIVR